MQTETKQYVDYARELAKWCLSDGNNLVRYLQAAAAFPDYSLNNQLLVMAFNPEARFMKSAEEWTELGITVNEPDKAVPLITPYQTEDGVGDFYIKWEYDYTATNYQYNMTYPDKEQVFEASLVGLVPDLCVVDKIRGSSGRALYVHSEKKIYVARSSKVAVDEFFTAVLNEAIHMKLAQENDDGTYRRGSNQILSLSATYAVGVSYGFDVSNINLSKLPKQYTELSEKKSLELLGAIRDCIMENTARIHAPLSKIIERDAKGAIYERS